MRDIQETDIPAPKPRKAIFGEDIPWKTEAKYLGLILDNTLTEKCPICCPDRVYHRPTVSAHRKRPAQHREQGSYYVPPPDDDVRIQCLHVSQVLAAGCNWSLVGTLRTPSSSQNATFLPIHEVLPRSRVTLERDNLQHRTLRPSAGVEVRPRAVHHRK